MCIGVICKRSPDLIAAMLAILKLGCAYVPMLPTYPQARLSYMMETAGVDVKGASAGGFAVSSGDGGSRNVDECYK